MEKMPYGGDKMEGSSKQNNFFLKFLDKFKNSPTLRIRLLLNLLILICAIGIIFWMGVGPSRSEERTISYMFTYIFIASVALLTYLNKK